MNHTLYTILTMHHTPYIIHHTPYTIHYTPYTIHYALCTTHHTSYTMHHTLCTMPHALCTIHHVPYTHHTPYTIHYAPCTIHHTPYTIHHTPTSPYALTLIPPHTSCIRPAGSALIPITPRPKKCRAIHRSLCCGVHTLPSNHFRTVPERRRVAEHATIRARLFLQAP
jgi:hypothetical protein